MTQSRGAARVRGGVSVRITFLAALAALVAAGCGQRTSGTGPGAEIAGGRPETARPAQRPYRILHVMSYHSPWEWTDDQLRGFRDALAGVPVQIEVFQLDGKRHSDEEWRQRASAEARRLLDAGGYDLLYTSDDLAQQYVARYYAGTSLPIVFSAVNADPADYGLAGRPNVSGVLEHEHFLETIALLARLVGQVSRIAVIVDDDPTWPGVIRRMKEKLPQAKGLEVVSWDTITSFEDYKAKVRDYQDKVDALGLLGIHAFRDSGGANVPWQDVLRWTAENSRLPDFSFWKDRVGYGTLCAVSVSGYEQGLAAGKIARGILAEGRSPASFPIAASLKGQPAISLARARDLGISVSSSLLLSSLVEYRFAWGP